MSESNSTSSAGIGVGSLLGVAFVVLKLTHYIDWPWVWVLAPFWMGIALVLVIVGVILIGGLLAVLIAAIATKKS